jgi:hypothetical protein
LSDRFDGGIGPLHLLTQVRNTARFLDRIPASDTGMEWLAIIRSAERVPASDTPTMAQREDYFSLCLACHHATVATYVPTDVDSKIRGRSWEATDREHLRRLFAIAQRAHAWDISGVSRRFVETARGRISGHDGEWLGVMTGALGAFHAIGDTESSAAAAAQIEEELQREAAAFLEAIAKPGREIDTLRLAAILTHNAGDVDQGLGYWRKGDDALRQCFGELAHEGPTRFSGAFHRAGSLYKRLLASEGHRHYPLRALACLRTNADLLLPIGPFFDAWGEILGTHPALDDEQRAEIAGELLTGCKKVKNQVGYYRALAGLDRSRGLDGLQKYLSSGTKAALKDAAVRKHLATSSASFEATYIKQVRAISAK